MAERFYSPDLPRAGVLVLAGDEARHLAVVRRLGPGAVVEVFDGRGFACRAEVLRVTKSSVELAAREVVPERAVACDLTLATAVPKGDRFDWLVEKATELGVSRLVPLKTARSSVDPRGTKLDRLRRTVIEASKQCGRSRLLAIDEPRELADYLRAESATVRLIAALGAGTTWPEIGLGSAAALAIGPEGGWTDDEREAARAAGWVEIGLGPTTLRVETAAVAGCAVVLSRAGGGAE